METIKVKIGFLPPFNSLLVLSEGMVELPRDSTVDTCLQKVVEAYPLMKNFVVTKEYREQLLVIRKDTLLQPADIVAAGDLIQLMSPLFGG